MALVSFILNFTRKTPQNKTNSLNRKKFLKKSKELPMDEEQEELLFKQILSKENKQHYLAIETKKDMQDFCKKLEKEFPDYFFVESMFELENKQAKIGIQINMYDKSKMRIKNRKTLLKRVMSFQIEPDFIVEFE